MKTINNIIVFVTKDILRSRWSIFYMLFFIVITSGLFYLHADNTKVATSLSSLCLVFVPLISLLYTTLYFYNSRNFIELVLAQPISRQSVFMGLYLGILLSLLTGFIAGVVIPYIILGNSDLHSIIALIAVIIIGISLSCIFTTIAILVAIRFDDRGKGLAVNLGIWLMAAILYDGIVLSAAVAFSEYPLEIPLLVATFINPVDLARVIFLIHSDLAALMGYTGAVFMRFFDKPIGLILAALSMFIWVLGPLFYGSRRFARKDF